MTFQFEPIGIVSSPFKQKFGIPRQPGLCPHIRGSIHMQPPYDDKKALEGIEGFSHLWISFVFHQTMQQGWKAQVRPPRLGGNKKIGVFATRSTFRPNPIGLSVVKLEGIQHHRNGIEILISGMDLLDATPVLDIKPYVAYSDCISHSINGFAEDKPGQSMLVSFSNEAERICHKLLTEYPDLDRMIEEILAQDPRPAYKKTQANTQEYAMRLYDFDIRWQVENNQTLVTSINSV